MEPEKKPAPKQPGTERLQVVLARFGIASRRGVVLMIEEGKVSVNGEVVREKGFRVDAAKDKIQVDSQELDTAGPRDKRYFLFNKPKGVMTTMQDPNAERTVADFFKDVPVRLFPVGRLDRDTTGVLLMTNDGELAFRLTHPKFGVTKKYRAVVEGAVPEDKIKLLEKGVELEEGMTAPCKIQMETSSPRQTVLTVTLHEGKKRQIRRIFETGGHWVTDLERLNFGPITTIGLKPGHKRELTVQEVQALQEATGILKRKRPRPSKLQTGPRRVESWKKTKK